MGTSVITSKLTSNAQTTIPQPVRTALGLYEGDEIAYSIKNGRVIISRAATDKTENPFHSFTEWNSDADRRAYGDL